MLEYSFLSFDKFRKLHNHQHNQDIEYFCYPQMFPFALCSQSLSIPNLWPLATADLDSFTIVLPFLVFYI